MTTRDTKTQALAGQAPADEDAASHSTISEFVKAAAIALALALFIRTFMFQPFKIPSESMVSTLLVGDHLLVNKMVYLFHPPERGDIIVFKYPLNKEKDFVKRIIGVPGDTVSMVNNTVYINGAAIKEPYAIYQPVFNHGHSSGFSARKIPEGKLFMMGDNRNNSTDSRVWGLVDISDIRGKAFIIHWSWKGNDFSVRLGRVGKLL